MTEKSTADRVLELDERLQKAKPRTPERYYAAREYESACVNLAPALARQVKALEAELSDSKREFLEYTALLDEHPESYDGPCMCALCRSYGE